jgi:hypothetical protein
VPVETPVTIPVAPAVATAGAELIHAPPLGPEADNVVVPGTQILVVPDTVPAEGSALTVMVFVAVTVLQTLVTL